ncbi:MAG: hypothetical protein BA871_07395 [Desulfuromonadales bacterium C00003096]|jgi:hypothetical protein|nr:MAG: hypothetical protein BA871_07395 [Desulfuromonadales bacterium C00003096]
MRDGLQMFLNGEELLPLPANTMHSRFIPDLYSSKQNSKRLFRDYPLYKSKAIGNIQRLIDMVNQEMA